MTLLGYWQLIADPAMQLTHMYVVVVAVAVAAGSALADESIADSWNSTGFCSHWRDCHFADITSPVLLKNLLKVEMGVAE